MAPLTGADLACPRVVRPDLAAATRRALKLGPTDPVPRCWSWSCSGCSHLRAWGIRDFIRLGGLEAASRRHMVTFATLTEPPLARAWDDSSKALTRLLAAETERLRRAHLDLPRWVAVPELQKRGAVHWHLLVSASEEATTGTAFRSKNALHSRAHAFGFGFQADVQHLSSARDIARRSGYLAKYLTTDVRIASSVSERYRRVRSSTGKRRWCSWGTASRCMHEWQLCADVTDHYREVLAA